MSNHLIMRLIHWPAAFALATFGLVLLISGLFINHELSRNTEKLKHDANVQLLALAAKLESEINADLVVMNSIETYIQLHHQKEGYEQDLYQLIEYYQQRSPSIRHIALAPDLVINFVHPLHGNEAALGLDYRTVPAQMASVQVAIDNRKTLVTGPINLVQGGTALVARVPVFVGEDRTQLWGIIAGVFHDRVLFERAGLNKGLKGFDIAIRSQNKDAGSEGKVFYGSRYTFTKDALSVDVQLPGGGWQLAAKPRFGWRADNNQSFIYWVIALLISAGFALALYFIVTTYREKLSAIQTAADRANYDVLTGLSNRYHFTQLFQRSIQEHQRDQQSFALFFMDVDYFKEVNDEWGHPVGDQLLCQFAERMKRNVRRDDLTARIAGDEFVIVLKNIESATQAEILAEKLKLELGEPYLVDRQFLSVTHSLGVAVYPQDGATIEALMQNADRAMYQAKREGKNRIVFFNHALNLEVKRHVQVHNEILQGIQHGQFELYFQPILSLESGRIDKCEALVRWNHPEKGMIPPIDFIPVAEQTGAIVQLGQWVLEEACHLLAKMKERGVRLAVSVNRSVAEFQPKGGDDNWLNTLEKTGIRPDEIVFEITESLLMEGAVSQLEKIHRLRDKGVLFSIDDFGTGYSAINYLRNYPVDYLKIDRSFVKDILVDNQDRTLVEVIIKMGQTLGIQVVAEGVENQAQLELLQAYGCDYVQGFYLGKPMPFDPFVAFLDQHSSIGP